LFALTRFYNALHKNTPVTINKTSHQKTMKISRKSKKGRQCNGQKKKDKDLQNTTQETNDWATRTPLKPGVNSGAQEEIAVPAPLVTLVVLLLNYTKVIGYGNHA